MARPAMANMILRLRRAIGDPAGASQVFAENDLQDFLDERRMEVFEVQLVPSPTTVVGLVVSYLDYTAPRGQWEEDVVLKDGTNAVLAPASSDYVRGHWTFAANQLPPVFLTGKYYDLYGSAVSALEAWIGKVALEFDFTADQQGFRRSQKREGLQALADSYRRRAMLPGKRPDWRAIYW